VGFLKKIAGLVVEFPEQPKPAAARPGATGGGGEDVLAAIEQARKELEGSVSANFDEGSSRKETKAAGTDKAAAATAPAIALPGVLSVSEVYERAKIASDPSGFDVYKVESMLQDPEMADLSMDIRARMVKMTLKSMNRELHEVLLDAARRDQALEQYAQWLGGKVEEVSVQVEAQNGKLQREMEDFIAAHNAAIEQNKRALAQARAALRDFQERKHAEEERLFNTVAPFVAPGENPVVIDRPRPPEAAPGKSGGTDTQEKQK